MKVEAATQALRSLASAAGTGPVGMWAVFLSLSLFIYTVMSDRDFSFLLTYGAFCRCFGLGVLVHRIVTSKSSRGVSLKTLQLYIVVFVSRLVSILRHQGYLPFDKTGDWFYHVVEVLSLVFASAAVYLVSNRHAATYDDKFDAFGNMHIPSKLGSLYLLVPCVLLAAFVHPSLNNEWFSDSAWSLSMYLEAVAILPQLYMFQRKAADEGGAVEWLISHFVFALGFARVSELIFWMSSYKELSSTSSSSYVGVLVVLTQLVHLIIMADFFYYYIRALRKGGPMELPTHMGV